MSVVHSPLLVRHACNYICIFTMIICTLIYDAIFSSPVCTLILPAHFLFSSQCFPGMKYVDKFVLRDYSSCVSALDYLFIFQSFLLDFFQASLYV